MKAAAALLAAAVALVMLSRLPGEEIDYESDIPVKEFTANVTPPETINVRGDTPPPVTKPEPEWETVAGAFAAAWAAGKWDSAARHATPDLARLLRLAAEPVGGTVTTVDTVGAGATWAQVRVDLSTGPVLVSLTYDGRRWVVADVA